jgi:hypothetical protein
MGGVFSEAVAGSEGGLDSAFGQGFHQDASRGDRNGQDCWLRMLSELELVFRPFEDEFGQGEAKGFVGFVEDGASRGEVIVEVAAHPDSLGALAGKEEGWFCHQDYRK